MTYEETAEIVILVLGAFPELASRQNANMAPTFETWFQVLGSLDEEVVRCAAFDLLDECKTFPAPSQVLAQAREIMRKKDPVLALPPADGFVSPERAREIVQAIKDGTAKKMAFGVDESKDYEFARKLFPGIGDEVIRKNMLEFKYARQRSETCTGCFALVQCPTNGLKPKLTLRYDGVVLMTMVPCILSQKATS